MVQWFSNSFPLIIVPAWSWKWSFCWRNFLIRVFDRRWRLLPPTIVPDSVEHLGGIFGRSTNPCSSNHGRIWLYISLFICCSDLSLNLATLTEMVNRWYVPNVRTRTQPNAAITVCCGMLFLCPKCLPSFYWMMDYNVCLGGCVYLGMWWNIELKILKGWSVL